jgi:hypothetical protein
MSRPKGNRKVAAGKRATGKIAAQAKRRPKSKQPVDRRVHHDEGPSKRERRRRAANRELVPGVDQRTWMAVWLASIISILGLAALTYSFTDDLDSSVIIGTRLGALAAVPLVYWVLAAVSKAPRVIRSVGLAILAFTGVFAAGALVTLFGGAELLLIAFTLPMALAIGGAFALRRKRDEALRTRIYVALAVSALGLFLALIPGAAILVFMLPFPSLILADYLHERRLKKTAETAAVQS